MNIKGEARTARTPETEAKTKPESKPVKTIWNSDGTDGPVLLCLPTAEELRQWKAKP